MIKQNILVVDDHRENLIAMEALLEGEGRQLIMAQSGNEALALALKHDFALVLLDVQMPEMDGFEVARLMRQNRKTRHIPIIFVTAISKERTFVFQGYQAGAVDYLFKPVDEQILDAKVNVFLQLDRQRRKLQQAVVQMKRLKDENERLLHALGEAVIGTDADGLVSFSNASAAALLNSDRDALLGQPVSALLAQGDSPAWCGPLPPPCAEGRHWEGSLDLYPDGHEQPLPLLVHANPVRRECGAFTGVVFMLRRRDEEGAGDGRRERRGQPRKRMFHELVVFDRGTGGNVGRLINLSVGGFKLLLRRDVAPGEQLELGMVLPDQIGGVNTMSFNARVVWSEGLDEPGEYHAGFQFLELSDANGEIIEILMERY
ncbi:response regulator [Alloalcanivorax gelatiniphagus]|uniref:Response regulator n=1 Tax=Alloalcanivorax gelatiniphagus TaxID=1194167 RepID=A0ABY2XQP1_9GAMM|nr:response regulator [Alloalcanivorax gelatiniphagus]TMW14005.1 response regulator [Alloalcanivorax gelatiniphagus]|tara:strand:+ start:13277 stop:14398 length:1122 start_codon:yes stop_codon:yes gene_type:complete